MPPAQGFSSFLTNYAAAIGLVLCFSSACADVGSALVDLRLSIGVKTSEGHPVSEAKIWFTDHKLPRQYRDNQPQSPICTTDRRGRCSAVVHYRYTVHRWPWQQAPRSADTPPDRFELAATVEDGRRISLGFLPPLTSSQLHGLEEVGFQTTVAEALN